MWVKTGSWSVEFLFLQKEDDIKLAIPREINDIIVGKLNCLILIRHNHIGVILL